MDWKEKIEYIEKIDKNNYNGYYNGYPLLKEKDCNKNTPEIFISTGNRTGGKTFFYKSFMILYALTFHTQIMLVVRKKTQLKSSLLSFYEDIQESPNFENKNFEIVKSDMQGILTLKVDDIEVMYVTYINYANDLKESSNMFNHVDIIVKDEFQSETGEYCEIEVSKMISIHKSVARGYNKPVRFVPLILIGNHHSIINPYYIALGIHKIFNINQRKYKGIGWVMELFFNKRSAEMASESQFDKAFGNVDYIKSATYNQSLDNMSLIRKQDVSKMTYLFTLCDKDNNYGVWQSKDGIYISTVSHDNFKIKYAINNNVLSEGVKSLDSSVFGLSLKLREYFRQGRLTFDSLESKGVCAEIFYINMLHL